MKRKPKRIFVGLAGGLGNQLFQISTAMCLTTGKVIVVECLGNPRRNSGSTDSRFLSFPTRVEFHNCGAKHLVIHRIFSLLISLSVNRNHFNRWAMTRVPIYLLSGIFLSIHFKSLIFPRVGNGTGFDASLTSKLGNMLVGYFQTFLYMQDSTKQNEIRSIRIKEKTPYLEEMELISAVSAVNMIHFRLGDYAKEPNIGILDASYYKKAIELLSKSEPVSSFWLFSDEPKLAIEKLPSEITDRIRLVEVDGVSAAEIFELMKICENFVLANSSLSWWGAFMSQSELKTIIAPDPWFATPPSPKYLIPHEWILVNRFKKGSSG